LFIKIIYSGKNIFAPVSGLFSNLLDACIPMSNGDISNDGRDAMFIDFNRGDTVAIPTSSNGILGVVAFLG
jgi:hypothetical protein